MPYRKGKTKRKNAIETGGRNIKEQGLNTPFYKSKCGKSYYNLHPKKHLSQLVQLLQDKDQTSQN